MFIFLSLLFWNFSTLFGGASLIPQDSKKSIIIPVGGNSWVNETDSRGLITQEGWQNWNSSEHIYTTYVSIGKTGKVKIYGHMSVPSGTSTIQCRIGRKWKTIKLKSTTDKQYLGTWDIKQIGYLKIELQGVKKTGDVFAKVSSIELEGEAIDDKVGYVKNNDDNYFYWGRRGPSVHLNYNTSAIKENIQWYYSEITVPTSNDVIGSYFMANGFAEGYFGMQVNSPTERRVLFSVWSPFHTDDPKSIPDDQKIIMTKKGKDVYTGEFGNEGSGGQSFLRYNWKAGQTYKFLLKGHPIENGYTSYTAYFFSPDENEWRLIASFNRPKTTTYLKRFHSFLENFIPSTGDITRKAYFHNQWVATENQVWHPIKEATFTTDNTGRKKFRVDYKGGVENNQLFMQNCGFFSDSTAYRSKFSFEPSSHSPQIDFSKLP